MFEDQCLVFFAAVPWDGLYARPQQLCTRFAKRGARVLYVEPPWTLLSPLRQPKLLRTWAVPKRVRRVDENLHVYTPPPLLPGYKAWRPINIVNQRILHLSIKKALQHLGWNQDLTWTHLPSTVDYPGGKGMIYDCVDDHAAFGGLAKRSVLLGMEDELLRSAAAVFASSQQLLARCQVVRRDTCLIGNGADYDHFAPAAKQSKTSPQAAIGYYGGIGTWIDLPLVFSVANLLPDHRFIMVGPVEPGVRIEGAPRNVVFTGLKKYVDLPAILAGFDVTMIPYRLNEVTASVNPVKIYEYFSAGKPVIVTQTNELTRFGDLVYSVSDAASFALAIGQALSEAPELISRRQAFALSESWDAKLKAIERHLGGDRCD